MIRVCFTNYGPLQKVSDCHKDGSKRLRMDTIAFAVSAAVLPASSEAFADEACSRRMAINELFTPAPAEISALRRDRAVARVSY